MGDPAPLRFEAFKAIEFDEVGKLVALGALERKPSAEEEKC